MRKLARLLVLLPALLLFSPVAASAQGTPTVPNLLQDQDSTSYSTAVYQGAAIADFNDWNLDLQSAYKTANPSGLAGVYKGLVQTRSDDCGTGAGGSPCIINGTVCPAGTNDAPYYSGGLPFCWTYRNHPGWFEHDTSGNLVTLQGFADAYLMRFDKTAYQNAWFYHVRGDAKANGWQWVFADNAIITTGYCGSSPATTCPDFSTDAAVQAGMQSMLANVGPRLQADGIKFIPNLGNNNSYPSIWASWLPYVSGFYNEFAYYWPGPSDQGMWSIIQAEISSCVSQSKTCIFNVTHDPLTQSQMDFAAGSLMLQTDGSQYMGFGTPGTIAAYDLGTPTDAASQDSSGVWHRDFTCGSVAVNSGSNGVGGTATVTQTC